MQGCSEAAALFLGCVQHCEWVPVKSVQPAGSLFAQVELSKADHCHTASAILCHTMAAISGDDAL
jgi:hypothetical protein